MDFEKISAWLFRETVQKWEDPHRMIFKWSKCDKSGSIAGHLKEHERTQMGEKPFKCTKCYKSFFTSSNLKTHERIHSGEIQVWQGRKVWQVFSTSSSLKEHERTHTGEKPFKCSKCDKSFSKSDLFFTSSYLKPMRGSTQEEFNSSAQSVTSLFNIKFLKGALEDPHRRVAFQMFKVRQELLNSWPLEET
jgi:hypothetical protein